MNDLTTIKEADFRADLAAIRAIRFAVFVDEQQVPPELELDERDPYCRQLLAFADREPVGTARIDLELEGKIGRLAVLKRSRRQGVGRKLMEACEKIARDRDLASVWCHAQIGAVPFYQSLGYVIAGPRFLEANIEHAKMIKAL